VLLCQNDPLPTVTTAMNMRVPLLGAAFIVVGGLCLFGRWSDTPTVEEAEMSTPLSRAAWRHAAGFLVLVGVIWLIVPSCSLESAGNPFWARNEPIAGKIAGK
jgi:hypothetical protein